MNGFLYDIKRTLTGKFTIILVILLVLVMGLSAYGAGITSDTAHPSTTAMVMPYINQTGGYINVSDYVVNGYGEPVSGLHLTSSLVNSSSPGAIIKKYTGSTNSAGYLNFTVKSSTKNFTYNYNQCYRKDVAMLHNIATSRNGKLSIYGNSASFAYPYYLINFNDSRYPLYAINLKDKSNPSLVSTMIYNPKYNSSDNSKIYYNISSNSPFHNYKLNSANTTYYGTVTSGKFIFTPSLNTADYGKSVNIYIVNKTNSVIIPGVSYEYAYQKPGILLQNELVIFFGILLIPIMGIFSAYFYYGKDKTSGVLESIIARPITKGKLMISRLIANSVSFLIGLIISMGFADIILEHYTGVFISSETFLVIIFGYLVEAIGFAGLVYLISQFEKSQGQVLGTGIGLLFVLGFMWKIITHGMLFLFHIHPGTGYYKDLVILNSISPSYYPNILAYYHTGLYATLHASSVGINIYSVIIVGLIWTIVPALTALYFARKRD